MTDLSSAAIAGAIRAADPVAPPRVTFDPDRILGATAEMFGLEVDAMWGLGRSRHHQDARSVAMLLIRAHCALSWTEVGEMFRRDAATCQGGVRAALANRQRLGWAKAVQMTLEAPCN